MERAKVLPVAFAIFVSGCQVERSYTRVQTEPGLAMTAPITFTVRVQVDREAETVTWMQQARDSRGVEDMRITTYGDGDTRFGGCEIFDDRNWTCRLRGMLGEEVEQPEMKDGVLTRVYWGEPESYEAHRRITFRR